MITKINFPMVNIQNETTIYISQFGQSIASIASIALNANMIKIFLILGIVVGFVGFGWKKVVANTYKNKEDSSTGIKEKGEENINIGEENINIGEENIKGEEEKEEIRIEIGEGFGIGIGIGIGIGLVLGIVLGTLIGIGLGIGLAVQNK